MYANHSVWMKREIDWAFARERYIIPVIPHQQQRMASVATDFGSCEPVHWRSESLRKAILRGVDASRSTAPTSQTPGRPQRAAIFPLLLTQQRPKPRRPTLIEGGLLDTSDLWKKNS